MCLTVTLTSVCDRARSTQVPAHIFNQDYARRTPEVQRQCSHRRYCASVKSRTNCAISICIVYILRIIKDLSRSCVCLLFFCVFVPQMMSLGCHASLCLFLTLPDDKRFRSRSNFEWPDLQKYCDTRTMTQLCLFFYLRQGGNVIRRFVCLSVFVCLLAGYLKKFKSDLDETWRAYST